MFYYSANLYGLITGIFPLFNLVALVRRRRQPSPSEAAHALLANESTADWPEIDLGKMTNTFNR